MPITLRHKNTLKNIRKYPTRQKAMIEAKYSKSYASSSHIKKTKGWQELTEKCLPDRELVKVHQEGLQANKVITSHTEPDKEYPDHSTRHKFLELAYKIKGRLKEWEGEEGRPLSQNILILIKKVYGDREGNRTGNTPDALPGEEPGLPGRSG